MNQFEYSIAAGGYATPESRCAGYLFPEFISECGELITAIHSRKSCDIILGEVGDCLWFALVPFAILPAAECPGIEIPEYLWVFDANAAIGPGSKIPPLEECCARLLAAATLYNSNASKIIREPETAAHRLSTMSSALIMAIRPLAYIAHHMGASLKSCAMLNLTKLECRYKRGAIIGDGDSR